MFMSRDGTILEANEAAEQAYGYQHDELLRLNLSDIRAIHTVHELEDQLAETMVMGVLRETEHRSKSGRVFPVEISARAVIIGGEPVILNIVRDISRRKAAEEAVIASERNLRQIMDLVPQAIYARNGEGRLILVNQRFAELAGKTPEELVTGAESSLADQSREADRNVLQSGQSMFIPEEMCTEEDGTVHTMQTSKTLFIPAGEDKPVLLSISTDITEGKRLAGGIAHDFNNLLQAILGFNELLMSRMDAGNPGQQEAMEIDKAAKRAGVLTKQLLAYSRKQVMDLQVRDLNAIVQNASGFIKRLVGNSVQIGIVLDPKIRSIRVDVNQIEQVLMNLVMNARDAMTDGGRITICTSSVHLTNERIRVCSRALLWEIQARESARMCCRIFLSPFIPPKGLETGPGWDCPWSMELSSSMVGGLRFTVGQPLELFFVCIYLWLINSLKRKSSTRSRSRCPKSCASPRFWWLKTRTV
jgi:PAS domain S-box-containing protein